MTDPDTRQVESGRVRPLRLAIAIQGFAYLITGLWPVLHLSSFLSVAGPKPDLYQLFATVLLVLAIGVALVIGSWPVRKNRPVDRGVYALAVATPAAFILVYLWAVAAGEALSTAYWADLVFEVVFLVVLAWLGLKSR